MAFDDTHKACSRSRERGGLQSLGAAPGELPGDINRSLDVRAPVRPHPCSRAPGGLQRAPPGGLRVRICRKEARAFRTRSTEPRNHAVSCQPLGLHNGLCGRFGQSSFASTTDGPAVRDPQGRPAPTWSSSRTRPGRTGDRPVQTRTSTLRPVPRPFQVYSTGRRGEVRGSAGQDRGRRAPSSGGSRHPRHPRHYGHALTLRERTDAVAGAGLDLDGRHPEHEISAS